MSNTTCDHDWQLVESGYSRYWSVSIDDDGTIHAGEDWMTDDGDGVRLVCLNCQTTRKDDLNIQWF
ncbi:hypothetical protein BJD55_gp024 [Gordonia phage Yvonnetastic]|uniref:Uncharacterized protein n=1 Tax=Gordonia phage Yvonnetastic TaxID=1821566 RepID=A0A142K9F9_9CAUD|nr:hypothetical protein BJD55_gp024 [Gordonia phage Yvonnetastic]AMS02742.1 hypothetical protein SEA_YVONNETASTIC_198 [Gordonia phage Yvonnetastic]WKW86170.1 hypothetical protein SEA_JONJAMES_197 [Gordonia Phage JonJames]